MGYSPSSQTANSRLSFQWLALGEGSADLVAMRCAIYGGELAWVGEGDATFAWDAYDRVSTALLVRDSTARLIASGRLTVEHDGPLEISDLVDWKCALPPELREAPAAEWSRVMIDRSSRGGGVFRRMYEEARNAAKRRGAQLLAGASVAGLRPHYERLGFTYLDRPFQSSFFAASPVYFPAYQVLA
jgi:GNAT superfamily N-acetyltransferase